MAFSPVSVSTLSSQDQYSDYICVKVVFSNHSPPQFLNLYYPPTRSTPSDSRTRTFSPDILPNSPDTFILGDFNAHHPTWDRLIPPNPPGNDLFRWITSSGLEILNDPSSPTLLYHSTGSLSSPSISLDPASLAPHCEWRTLPGLVSDHLPIEIVLPLSPVRHPNTRPPKFNYKKTSWDVYQSYIAEHLPSLDVDALNIHQAACSFSLFLVEAARASIPFGRLGRSPHAWWSQEVESAVQEQRRARSEAHQSEAHRLRYIDASRRASSVICRAKSATWQATCSNLFPHSDPCAVFKLLLRLPLNPKKCESSFFSTDPHQATIQPRLNLLGIPLLFNPTPKFLGVTFDRTLSFGAHVQSLCSKFFPRHKALRSIATASWGPTKESLSLLYRAVVRPVLTYASPGWFPFLSNTATNHLEVLHRAACRVITGCLSSTPSSLLLLEAQLPSLKLTLEHQTLYSFERALVSPQTSPAFMPWQQETFPVD